MRPTLKEGGPTAQRAHARVSSSTALSIASTSWTRYPLSGVNHDPLGMFQNGSLVVPITGLWDVYGYLAWGDNAVGARIIGIYANGAQIILSNILASQAGTGGTVQTVTLPATVLAAGAIIDLYGYQGSGAALNIASGVLSLSLRRAL